VPDHLLNHHQPPAPPNLRKATGVDPVALEILWNRLISVVNEQAAALMRTSFTSIVREAGDLSACVFDARGDLLAQAVTGTPGHINPMQAAMRHFLAALAPETLEPGDVLVTNNPWQTAGHLNDITVVTPIFQRGELVAFIGNICHALDIGGRTMGADARDVYEEGFSIPICKLFRRGEPDPMLFRLIETNVRTPLEVIGDLHAQTASNDVGARRVRPDDAPAARRRAPGPLGAGHARRHRRRAGRDLRRRRLVGRLRGAGLPEGEPGVPGRRGDRGL
jgi:N-methylhydantoinase B